MNTFTIDKELFQLFPETIIGVVVARNIQSEGTEKEAEKILRESEKISLQLHEGTVLSEHPTIQSWRKAYKIFKAGDYRCSAENLAKRALRGNPIPSINPLVDLYNAISLKYVLPVGGEDLSKIQGDIKLCVAQGDEQFIPLGSEENDPPEKDEVVYKDDKNVICRKWNWRESEITKLTPETHSAIFFIEGLHYDERERIEKATAEYAEMLNSYCQADCSAYLLTRDDSSINIDL